MTELRLWIPCIPPKATSQMKGMTRTPKGVRFFKKAEVAQAERIFLCYLKANIPAEWQTIESGPIQLDVSFCWPWKKTELKRNMEWPLLHMDVKPDCSNIIKMLEDCMTKLNVWKDDGQVADLRVRKFWGESPGINIRVEKIRKYEEEAFNGQDSPIRSRKRQTGQSRRLRLHRPDTDCHWRWQRPGQDVSFRCYHVDARGRPVQARHAPAGRHGETGHKGDDVQRHHC